MGAEICLQIQNRTGASGHQADIPRKTSVGKMEHPDVLKKVWLFIIIAIGIGEFIHGYVPEDFLARYAGPQNPFAVPVAVAIGVPLYSSAAGIIPIVYALME